MRNTPLPEPDLQYVTIEREDRDQFGLGWKVVALDGRIKGQHFNGYADALRYARSLDADLCTRWAEVESRDERRLLLPECEV